MGREKHEADGHAPLLTDRKELGPGSADFVARKGFVSEDSPLGANLPLEGNVRPMNLAEDRRNPKVQRVELTTLVDICESGSKLPPFQGESANVSGRGMHLRTSHLPEVGQPLVCRFEHEGSEILVEGRVAWRSEGTDGGEFGVQFTAVDAGSADVLRRLKSGGSRNVPSFLRKTALVADGAEDDDTDDDEADAPSMAVGDRVKLHIEGLASPMKASVQEAFSHKVRVGSNLEFLKMGRSIEIEQLKSGQRQGARVDSINVVMNPSTSVPELVVMLRYDSEQASPAPGYAHDVNAEEPSEEEEEDPEAPWHPAALALESRLSQAFGAATTSLKRATSVLSGAGAGALRAAQGAATKVIEQRAAAEPKVKVAKAQPIRRTSERSRVRPSNVSNIGAKRARLSSHPGPTTEPQLKRRFVASRGVVALGLSVASAGALLLLWPKSKEVPPAAKIVAAATPPAASAPVEAPASAPAPKVSPEGIVAEVPLFGPRAITTTEPARTTPADEAAAEKRAAAAEVPDETFSTEESSRPTTFARGKLNLPTVHRIRLDGAGSEVVGVVESKGFSVVVPGRKAMETGRAIEKRDRRILHVKSSNTAEGARILFEFRGPVPPYKVRLKNDFIEFLISAPEGTDAGR